jgi:hypothetical protein
VAIPQTFDIEKTQYIALSLRMNIVRRDTTVSFGRCEIAA